MAKVLVTGGAGFIGSHVVERFLKAGHEVSVLDDFSAGTKDNVPAGVDLHVMDVGSQESAALVASAGFDVIAHLAAQIDVRKSVDDPGFDARTNILGTLNILEAARGLPPKRRPRIIFASTGGALYGGGARVPSSEETPANPDAPYGVAKLAAELYLAYYARMWKMDTVVLRFGNVYGPRQNPHGDAGVIAIFAGRIARGQVVEIYGAGTQTRDFVFVGDVADAFLAAATASLPDPESHNARAFNIGTGVETSVLELAKMLGETAGAPARIEFKPARAGEVERSLLAVGKAERVLNWRPRVDMAAGLARTYAWVSRAGADRGLVG